jgi:translation initiation factor IF-2
MEDWSGKTIKEASLSAPVGIVGWNDVPHVGDEFYTVGSKKEAERAIFETISTETVVEKLDTTLPLVPLLIKADVLGTIDAIKHELQKFSSDRITVRVIESGVGAVTASDVQNVSATENAIIVGFNVKIERAAQDVAERLGVEIKTFNIIYELSEWLESALRNRTPKREEEQVSGSAKILKQFSLTKHAHVLGGRVQDGTLSVGQHVNITRRDIPLGSGVIKNLQQAKSDVQQVSLGEFGMHIDSKVDIAAGDIITAFTIVIT